VRPATDFCGQNYSDLQPAARRAPVEGNLRAARENVDKIKTICGGVGCYTYASLPADIANMR
jgi:hypothetical protein